MRFAGRYVAHSIYIKYINSRYSRYDAIAKHGARESHVCIIRHFPSATQIHVVSTEQAMSISLDNRRHKKCTWHCLEHPLSDILHTTLDKDAPATTKNRSVCRLAHLQLLSERISWTKRLWGAMCTTIYLYSYVYTLHSNDNKPCLTTTDCGEDEFPLDCNESPFERSGRAKSVWLFRCLKASQPITVRHGTAPAAQCGFLSRLAAIKTIVLYSSDE